MKIQIIVEMVLKGVLNTRICIKYYFEVEDIVPKTSIEWSA